MNDTDLAALHAAAIAAGKSCVVGAVILNERGQAFVQKRSLSRKIFPGGWDIVGGHVEPGETLIAALRREIAEETGWTLRRVTRLLGVLDWTAEDAAESGPTWEADFVADVAGDLLHPRLETDKHTAFLWVGLPDIALLHANRVPGDDFVIALVRRALTP